MMAAIRPTTSAHAIVLIRISIFGLIGATTDDRDSAGI
jgi:hypothetical protein